MPVLIMMMVVPTGIALTLAVRSSGWKKIAAWIDFGFLALMLLVGCVGGAVLGAFGLAWRSCIKAVCGLLFVAGVLILMVWAAAFVWRSIAWWKPVTRFFGHCVIAIVSVVFLVMAGWYGLLFAAIWAGDDHVTEIDGRVLVVEQSWMDWEYYAYHGPLVRGKDDITVEEMKSKNAARKKIGKALELDLDVMPDGTVEYNIDNHGGFHGDGTTYIQIQWEDGSEILKQIEGKEDWYPTPMPENLRKLALRMSGLDVQFPADGEIGEGYYFFMDRHNDATDRQDYTAALGRYSYNFTLVIYSINERTLYYCEVDT